MGFFQVMEDNIFRRDLFFQSVSTKKEIHVLGDFKKYLWRK